MAFQDDIPSGDIVTNANPAVDRTTAVLSIRPVYADRILDGTKTVEFRRQPLPEQVERVLIWRTGKGGGFAGSFTIGGQQDGVVNDFLAMDFVGHMQTFEGAGIDADALYAYAGHMGRLVGITVQDVVRFSRTYAGWELGTDSAPQSWRYAHAGWIDALLVAARS